MGGSVEMGVVHGVCHEHEHEGRQKSVIKLMSQKVKVTEAAAVVAAIVDSNDEH